MNKRSFQIPRRATVWRWRRSSRRRASGLTAAVRRRTATCARRCGRATPVRCRTSPRCPGISAPTGGPRSTTGASRYARFSAQ